MTYKEFRKQCPAKEGRGKCELKQHKMRMLQTCPYKTSDTCPMWKVIGKELTT